MPDKNISSNSDKAGTKKRPLSNRKTGSQKKTRRWPKVFSIVIILLITGFLLSRLSIDNKGMDEVESKVRDMVYLDDNDELQNTLLINSPEALDKLRSQTSGSYLQDAKVGDYYLAFKSRGVLYRPDSEKIVYLVPIKQQQ